MSKQYEIRADYDDNTIVVYQAYSPAIADAAVAAQRFVPPFSRNRMTWIKPSFLWMMERSNWGLKANQERILAVRIARTRWDEAIALGVLTHPDPSFYRDADEWRAKSEGAAVRVQWDPERDIRGAHLPYRSIQVGLSRHIMARYVDEWTIAIVDETPRVRKIHTHAQQGHWDTARRLLPPERIYPMPTQALFRPRS